MQAIHPPIHPSPGLDQPDVSFHHSSFPVHQFACRSCPFPSFYSLPFFISLLPHYSCNTNNKTNKTHLHPPFLFDHHHPAFDNAATNRSSDRAPRRPYESILVIGAFERDAFPKSSTLRFVFCFCRRYLDNRWQITFASNSFFPLPQKRHLLASHRRPRG
ncbi:hypothetical protein CGRA01v4_11634 [Colletotrichum graminicola]|nr:hypothetical protein CGRA01v4_11634 [Colletotrichum graminicola]